MENSTPSHLVATESFGIKGINFYWTRRERFGMSGLELNEAGVFDDKAYVDAVLREPLCTANDLFQKKGFELIVKDAYRSPDLYQLIQRKRYEVRGKEETDKLLNMVDMPHTTGRTIDVNLIDRATGEELKMRNPEDDPDAFFINFYKEKEDPVSRLYQERQVLLVETMLSAGFVLGSKKEFWHFEYKKA